LPRPAVMLAAAAAIPEAFLTAASLGTAAASEPSGSAVVAAPLSSALAAALAVVDADVGNKGSVDGWAGRILARGKGNRARHIWIPRARLGDDTPVQRVSRPATRPRSTSRERRLRGRWAPSLSSFTSGRRGLFCKRNIIQTGLTAALYVS
jgi:hypothetical protein